MCRKTVIEVIDFDTKDKQKREDQEKALKDLRTRLMQRQGEIQDALAAIKAKLGY